MDYLLNLEPESKEYNTEIWYIDEINVVTNPKIVHRTCCKEIGNEIRVYK